MKLRLPLKHPEAIAFLIDPCNAEDLGKYRVSPLRWCRFDLEVQLMNLQLVPGVELYRQYVTDKLTTMSLLTPDRFERAGGYQKSESANLVGLWC